MKVSKIIFAMIVVHIVCFSSTFAQPVYNENFNGDANGWITLPSNNIVNNAFLSIYSEFALWIYPGGEISGDFTFELDATILERYNEPGGADHISLCVNVPWDPVTCQLTSNNYYQFTTRQDGFHDVYLNDTGTGVFRDHAYYTLNPMQGTHHYKIQKSGNTYRCYIDGEELLTWTSSSMYSGGYVGFSGGQGYTGIGTPPSIQWDNGTLPVEMNELPEIPTAFSLNQNFPNPFNPTTSLSFTIPASGEVSITIYDIQGREIERLVEGRHQAGTHEISWNASDLPSGIYFARLTSNGQHQTRKLVLMK